MTLYLSRYTIQMYALLLWFQYTLLTELREVVMPEDRGRFDELVYRRESEGQRLQHNMMDGRHSTQHTRVSLYYFICQISVLLVG